MYLQGKLNGNPSAPAGADVVARAPHSGDRSQVKFYFQMDEADVSNGDAVLKQAPGPALSSVGDETIMARIADVYPTLSRAHRRAADFVLKHPFQAATMMIDELPRPAGISVPTANRFARALGIDGYPAFRAELVRTFRATLAPAANPRAHLPPTAG